MSVNFRDLQKASCLKGMRDRSNHLGRRDCLQICPRQCCTAQTAEGTGCCRATTSSRYFRGLRAIDRPLHANQRCFASDPPGSCSHLWLTCPRNPWISWCKLLRPKDVQTDGFFPKHRFSMLTSEPRPRFQEAVNIRRQQLQVLKETEGAGADMLTTSATPKKAQKRSNKNMIRSRFWIDLWQAFLPRSTFDPSTTPDSPGSPRIRWWRRCAYHPAQKPVDQRQGRPPQLGTMIRRWDLAATNRTSAETALGQAWDW